MIDALNNNGNKHINPLKPKRMDRNIYKLTTDLLFLVFIIMSTGCSSIIDARKQKKPYMDNYYAGNVKLRLEN
ncbi:MAG: hypothetical protein DRQ62_06045 [Gammaproteobacteria bacterium]|nr:MAG: hypothetical protein DRQ62_06045 [Gammaproteobacteria bacterium]